MNTSVPSRTTWIALGALLLFVLGEGIYTVRLSHRITESGNRLESTVNMQGETIQKLARSIEQADAHYGELQGNFRTAEQRLGKTQADLQRARQLSDRLAQQHKEATEQLSQLRQEQVVTQGTVGTLSSDVSGVKQEVSLTKDQLASTRSELQRVVGDLGVQSDLIAHNRDELGDLRLRGERDYHEFDLKKSKAPIRLGSVSLLLRKTDVKRQKYTLNLVADDRRIEKKDKTINEPVQFYQDGYRQPTEIVVNQVYKDRIVGYVSVPKQKAPRPVTASSGPGSPKSTL